MKPVKRRRIGLLTKERNDDGTNESGQETRAHVIEEDDNTIKITIGGDTEDELEDELDDDDVDIHHSSTEASPLTTRVLIRYYFHNY